MFKLQADVFYQPGIGWTAQILLTIFRVDQVNEFHEVIHALSEKEAFELCAKFVKEKMNA